MDRLREIEQRVDGGAIPYYADTPYIYEDMKWLIAEVERLREENAKQRAVLEELPCEYDELFSEEPEG